MDDITALSLNCWGLRLLSSYRIERLTAIATEIRKYDVVALQEVWSKEDYKMMKEIIEDQLPYSHMFYRLQSIRLLRTKTEIKVHCGVIGSGLCIFSRYQIVGSCFHQFTASGGVFDLLTGELFAAKGIGMCRIQLPNNCVISLYNSHTNPKYRETQLFECMQFIYFTKKQDPVIMCGDLNTLPNHSALKLLTTCLELQDTFYHESCNASERFHTCDRNDNVFKKKNSVPQRIDYIMYSDFGSAWLLSKKEFCITMDGMIPGKAYNYSDHVGLSVVFKFENRASAPDVEEISFVSAQKQIVFQDIRSSLTQRTKELKESYCSHSRLVYIWIFYFLLIFGLSLIVLQYAVSAVFQVFMLVASWLILGRNIVGSLVAFGQLSAQKNVLEDIQYYMK